jgi:predicted Zn finger-like uncharacterized protein
MLIICPNCSSSYLVRAEEIAPDGKLVRCGVCKTSWRPEMEANRPQSPLDQQNETAAPLNSTEPPAAKTPSRPARWALPLAGLSALAATWVAIVTIPGTSTMDHVLSRAKDWLAMIIPDHPADGLRLANIRTRLTTENGERALIIEGEILSDRRGDHPVPGLQFTMTDGDANAIFQWMIPAPAPSIASGAPLPFSARLASPPRDAKDIRIRFAGA